MFTFPFNYDVRVSLHGTCFIIGRSRLQNQITLRLVFFSWQLLASLFIVHEYWRNSTSYIASCHPLKDSYSPNPFHQRTVFRQTNYSFSLPLRDKEVATNFTISCPSIKCIRLHGLCRSYGFAVHTQTGFILSICFSGTVGTRFLA